MSFLRKVFSYLAKHMKWFYVTRFELRSTKLKGQDQAYYRFLLPMFDILLPIFDIPLGTRAECGHLCLMPRKPPVGSLGQGDDRT